MANQGSAKMLEAGVIATYVLGNEKADAFVAGGALTGKFLAERPDVARRFAAAWGKALADIAKDDGVRKHLVKNTFTPPDLAPTMPLVKFVMVGDLSAEDRAEFQQFIDFATETKILEAKVDTAKYLKTF
jgi:NitT/TauT family transport system substrate-binding protein